MTYGAHVKKGDVLAEIETPDLDAQLAAAQAKLNSARAVVKVREAEEQFAQSTYQRWRDSPKGVVSVQEQESKQADYNSAMARLSSATAEVAADQGEVDRLQALESFKRITAPFDGVVTARETDIGALINAGSGTGGGSGPELFQVADIHMMRVYVQVPQQLSAGIKAGLTAELQLAAISGQDLQGGRRHHLERHQSRTRARSWSSCMPTIRTASCSRGPMPRSISSCRAIPTSCACRPARSSSASAGWRSPSIGPDNKIELKPITLGRNLGTEVEVVKGLTLPDRLVNSPPDSLATGDKVRIAGARSQCGHRRDRRPAAGAKPH